MSIIVVRPGMPAHRVERTVIRHERDLQQYIYEHPDTLPFDQLKPDAKILVLLREFPTGSGPVDAFAVDADGDVYLIETKLYKNPDKRLVVAQALGYRAAVHRLHDWAAEHADEVRYGTGTRTGSFSVECTRIHVRSVFTVYSDGTVTLDFRWLRSTPAGETWAARLAAELGRVQWLTIPADFKERYVSFGAAEWTPHVSEFIGVLGRLAA
jgi:hypothetical protein